MDNFVVRSCACGFKTVLSISVLLALFAGPAGGQHVKLVPAPDGGIQPQAAVDAKGIVHMIYFKGDPKGGDIFYVRRETGSVNFSSPLLVNSKPRTANAMGTIRGAQLAIGKNGRVHVAWDGMGSGVSNEPGSSEKPLYFARLNEAGTAFESERNVITYAYGLDGGSSVAADPQGNVYVVWHAPQPGNTNGEAGRAVFVARSIDEGKTFAREELAINESTGACACCGMRAFADRAGVVYILFRAAGEKVNRDETLLLSPKPGAPFVIANRHEWKATACPMSSATLTEGRSGTLAAWETASQVYFASVNPTTMQVSKPISPQGNASRKHPVAVANSKGEILFVWTEGTAWNKGGAVAFQLFDADQKPLPEKGRTEGLKTWSLPTAFANPDGTFTIVY